VISFAATALRLNAQPCPLQRIRTRVPRGVLTVTRVSVVRVPLKRPAMRITGNGLINGSVVPGVGSDPPPVWVPDVNVPLPGPVGVTCVQVSLSPTFGRYGSGTTTAVGSESADVVWPPASVTVSRTCNRLLSSAERTVYSRPQAPVMPAQLDKVASQRNQVYSAVAFAGVHSPVVAVSVAPDWREPEMVGFCVIVAASAAVAASTTIATASVAAIRHRQARFS
jgi:hypothetical protein